MKFLYKAQMEHFKVVVNTIKVIFSLAYLWSNTYATIDTLCSTNLQELPTKTSMNIYISIKIYQKPTIRSKVVRTRSGSTRQIENHKHVRLGLKGMGKIHVSFNKP